MTVDMLPWVVAAAAVVVLLVAMLISARAQRRLQEAHAEALAARDKQIKSLESQFAALRESESIRFVDRYLAAKKGLEERIANLGRQLDTAREEQDKIRDELNDLDLSDSSRQSEKDRLLHDLNRTTDQIKRLEVALREVANVGPIDVNIIRDELEKRRELSLHIHERLERLRALEPDRLAARTSRAAKLERSREEAARLRRAIEITRAATSIVDGILGIDSEVRKRLARHASNQIAGALETLTDATGKDPISNFVDVLERRPDRLLETGTAQPEPATEPPAARVRPPTAAETRGDTMRPAEEPRTVSVFSTRT